MIASGFVCMSYSDTRTSTSISGTLKKGVFLAFLSIKSSSFCIYFSGERASPPNVAVPRNYSLCLLLRSVKGADCYLKIVSNWDGSRKTERPFPKLPDSCLTDPFADYLILKLFCLSFSILYCNFFTFMNVVMSLR